MPDRRYRVLAVATHPVQYMTPIFRRMAKHPLLDFEVAYCTLRGAEAGHDPEFGASIQWDVPLLDGYSWTHVPNRGSGAESFFGLFNPRMWRLIRSGKFDAVLCFIGYVRATFWMALLAAKLSKSAFLFGTDTTTLAPRDGRAWKTAFKKILWPRLFRLADQVLVPSSGSRDVMLSLGIPGDRVTLTPYSVDNDWWMPQASQVHRSAVRGAWGAGEHEVSAFLRQAAPLEAPRRSASRLCKSKYSGCAAAFCRGRPASFTARIRSRQSGRRFERPFSWVRQSIAASRRLCLGGSHGPAFGV